LPRDAWPEEEQALIAALWEEPYGDRRQELVLIGQELDEANLRARLDACLLSDAEFALGPMIWRSFTDPFGEWMDVADDED
jgi:hypothetical protein